VSDYLVNTFDELTSPAYVAQLHAEIAHVASGERGRLDVLRAFWSRFGDTLRPVSTPPETAVPAAAHKPIVLRPVEEV
jgi:hypothetical protein